jgi:hypothetical protein
MESKSKSHIWYIIQVVSLIWMFDYNFLWILLFDTAYKTALGPTQPPIQVVPGALSPGGKTAGSWSQPLTSIQFRRQRMRGVIPPLPQYVFIAWCLVKHKENFTFLNVLTSPEFSGTHTWNGSGSTHIKFCYRVRKGDYLPTYLPTSLTNQLTNQPTPWRRVLGKIRVKKRGLKIKFQSHGMNKKERLC